MRVTIHGLGEGCVFAITSGTIVLEGLDITGGRGCRLGSHSGNHGGGGVYIVGGTLTMNNCNIFSNTAPYANGGKSQLGGGVRIYYSTVTFNDCNIYDNDAQGSAGTVVPLFPRQRRARILGPYQCVE